MTGRAPFHTACLGWAYGKAGKLDEARDVLNELSIVERTLGAFAERRFRFGQQCTIGVVFLRVPRKFPVEVDTVKLVLQAELLHLGNEPFSFLWIGGDGTEMRAFSPAAKAKQIAESMFFLR